ncbi:MAG: hypothetical protein K5695_15315 [Oscillospiraceae bacterium]|nr:hypothetical protein [Oscillospiraceae bacterium]
MANQNWYGGGQRRPQGSSGGGRPQQNQNWEVDTGMSFINPYTFAALGGDVVRQERRYGDLTGKISCLLSVKTPLALPDTEHMQEDGIKHKSFPFFRLNGEPAIPGSQLRGAVRSVFETLSNSCLSVNNNNILSSRHTAPRRPGILQKKDGVWHLYQAEMERITYDLKPGKDEVIRKWKNPNLARKFHLDPNDVFTYVFTKGAEVPCKRLDAAVSDYLANIDIYKENAGNDKIAAKLIEQLTIKKTDPEGKLYPLFYETVKDGLGNSNIYLCPSQLGRTVYAKKLDDLLGTHRSCSKRSDGQLCPACALFGTLTQSKEIAAFAGQLRFTDASAVSGTVRMTPSLVTLKELASPKTTSVEFYTVRPKDPKTGQPALYWTYESMTSGYDRKTNAPYRKLVDVALNGRKFYFHAPELKETDYSTKDRTKRNSSMELCQPGAQFRFEIYFERITPEQLHALVWALTLGENTPDSPMQYKLGHGKPLGLGDVKITVEEIGIRRFDSDGYRIEMSDPAAFAEMPFNKADKGVQDLLKILNVHTLDDDYAKGRRISYPKAIGGGKGDNAAASHQWFKANREMGEGGKSFAWSAKYTLPPVSKPDHSLPGFVKSGAPQGGFYGKKR